MGELSPKVTERARTPTERNRRSDSIALSKNLLIAVRRLSGDELALSVCFADTSPKGRGSGVSVRLSFVQPLRRFAPAPLVGEPLAKR